MRTPSATWRLDLHVHSRHSGDSMADPVEAVERAIELGLDGIAFTEHGFFGASAFAEGLQERYRSRILILRGVEFSAAEGHCLVFGADTDRLVGEAVPVQEVVRAVTAAGGAVIPSHPFRGGSGMGDLVHRLPGICALEGCNGVNMHAMNRRALEAAAALSLPTTGGSDAHLAREVGSCFTVFEERVTAENFVPLLKRGRFRGVDTRKPSRAWIPGFR